MLLNTRRRMLGLLAAALGASRLLPPYRQAFAKTKECFALQAFGDWKGVATNSQAGARIGQINFTNADGCDLRAEIQISSTFDGKLVVYGDAEGTRLPKPFLIRPENRLIVRNEDGTTAVDEPLCGVCNEIHDDKVSVILPLATAPLFRSSPSIEMAVKLGEKEECRFTLNCEDLRKALDWATERQGTLAQAYEFASLHASPGRLLPHHRLLRGARPDRRLLRAFSIAPLSRPGARNPAGRQRRYRLILPCRAIDP